ncbi:MAG: FAD-dependent oxidoreductase, partial [Fimbriimonadales bacterium]
MDRKRAVVVGAGFGGSAAASRLARLLPASEWEVVLVDRNNYLLFYPLLPEVAAGTLEPRHVVVPARSFLPKGRFVCAEVTGLDLRRRRIHLANEDEPAWSMPYDHLVLALGSVTRMPPVPGLREHGFELKTIADAASLRDHGISLLERAAITKDPELRRELLRVVVVGANFTGVELAGEYQDFLRDACRAYPELNPDDVDVVVVEARSRILPALPEGLANYALTHLERRGLRFATQRTVVRVDRRGAELSDGTWLPSRTVVWCAGIAPNPLIAECGDLPKNDLGYIETSSDLRLRGFDDVWAIGDSAFVPQADGQGYPATAQVASRQGEHVARNIARAARGQALTAFSFRSR